MSAKDRTSQRGRGRGRGRGSYVVPRGTRTTTQSATETIDPVPYFPPSFPLVPKANINYTTINDSLIAYDAAKLILDTSIVPLFKSSFSIAIPSAGFGEWVMPAALTDKVSKVYVEESSNNLRNILSNNLKTLQVSDKVAFRSTLPPADILLVDQIKDPSLVLLPEYSYYIVRTDKIPTVPAGYKSTSIGKDVYLFQVELKTDYYEVDETYLASLTAFLDDLLAKIIPEGREAYFDPDLMGLWVQAFTHESVDPNLNYQVLEMLGDRLTKTAFADMLIQTFPSIDENILTELQNYFLTEKVQPVLARNFGFTDHIRVVTAPSVPDKVMEDVLESFIGALFRVSEEVAGGLGYYNVLQMINVLYANEDIVGAMERYKYGQDKTFIKQNMVMLELELHENFFTKDNTIHYVLTLDDAGVNFFAQKGINMPREIGHGINTAKKKSKAEEDAYAQAVELFRKKGITREWIKTIQDKMIFSRPRFAPYLATAQTRLKREGYAEMSFYSPTTLAVYGVMCVTQLIGHKKDGTKVVLATAQARNCNDSQTEALRIYAGK